METTKEVLRRLQWLTSRFQVVGRVMVGSSVGLRLKVDTDNRNPV